DSSRPGGRAPSLRRADGAVHQRDAQALAGTEPHRRSRPQEQPAHARARRPGRGDQGRGPRHRHRRVAGHDRARRRGRRLAGDLREGAGRGHPGPGRSGLARRQQLGDEAGRRTALRLLRPAQRRGPVRLLRPRRRMRHHRQRGRRQALRDERAVQPAAPGLHHPAAGRRRLDRRGRAGPVLPRPGVGRPGERLHPPQHDVHDLQPDAPRRHAACCRRRAGVREPTQRVGRRLRTRPGESRAPL
ncbi:MAG: BRAMP, partial [uncultured Nocardioidaceae bacterium]